jgi:2-oxoglutarate/2-oxoacid ferredoxin oxidoreductase subunit alpha
MKGIPMEVNIRISGSAGQGIQTAADLLGKISSRYGLYCYSYSDVESRIRGGCNSIHLRISTEEYNSPKNSVDILVCLTPLAYETHAGFLKNDGIVIVDKKVASTTESVLDLSSFMKNKKSVGTVAVSMITSLMGIPYELVQNSLNEKFAKKPEVLKENLMVTRAGYDAGKNFAKPEKYKFDKNDNFSKKMWISGAESLSMGILAGGASFMSAYPMSPATGIMTNLAQWGEIGEIHVEQAEDEISAINMVAGAAYAGARALTATSGGGFALMTEGISLLGMIETPAVIIIAQRPGPATGLPTKTAQGDLRFAIHGGHGFFPKIVLGPSNIEKNFEVGYKAFDLAEKYQIPVIILTDQQLQDSKETIKSFDLSKIKNKRYILTSEELEKIETYKRYELTKSGISPMAVPGSSKHVVVVDSDEHDEDGHLTELSEIAIAMAEKRWKKHDLLIENAWKPYFKGENSGEPVFITWGSTFESVKECQSILENENIKVNHLHLDWLYPLDKKMFGDYLDKGKLIVVENSAGREFESVLREVVLKDFDSSIRKLDGRPFTISELLTNMREVI